MEEIKTAEKIFEALDHVPAGICVLRKDLVVIFWNRCLEDWTGIHRDKIVGSDISAKFPHFNSPKYSIRLQDIFGGGPPTIFSSQLHGYLIPSSLRDGQFRIQHATVTPVRAFGEDGFYALIVIQDVTDLTRRIQDYRAMRDKAMEEIKERKRAEEELREVHEELEVRVRERTSDLNAINERLRREITERKHAEEALRDSEERYRTLFEESRDAIYITTIEGRFIDVNKFALGLFGYTREEMVKLNAIDIYANPDDRKRFQDEISEKGSVRDYEVKCRRKDGKEIDTLLTSTLRRSSDGSILGYQGIFRDITERKKIEEELLRARKLESVGVLAGGIAHDFNNLLTAILGNISLARMFAEPGSEVYGRLVEAEKASIKAKDLTRQLLTFSVGGAPIKRRTVIKELIRESSIFALTGSRVKCEFSIPEDLWPVEVDEGQIRQVMNNLIINAREAIAEVGVIQVRAENITIKTEDILPLSVGRYVKLSIRDQGVGIPKEYLEKIFDPYFTTKQKGSGLGLATVYSIIKNHNGFITVESQPGVGTTFCIYLPASQPEITGKKEEERPILGKGRVLVMDDEEMVREVAGKILVKIGYGVEFARDGVEAIEMYKKAKESGQPFDVIIMDLTIPGGMGGRETIPRLIEFDPKVKAIVSSGYANDLIMAEFREYGFRGVVAKPYTIREFSAVLHSVMAEE